MTVLGWDHHLTFGVSNRPGAGGWGAPPGGAPGGGVRAPAGGGRGPGGPAANPLVTRFEAAAELLALETAATARLKADLYAGGVATASLERWSALLASDAGSLLDASPLASEQATIRAYFG